MCAELIRRMRCVVRIFLFGLVFLGVDTIHADQSVVLEKQFTCVDLVPHVFYLKDSSNSLVLADVMSEPVAARFQPSAWKETPNFSFSDATHWFRFRIISKVEGHTSCYIIVDRPRLDRIGYYVVQNNQVIRQQEVGNAFPDAKRDVPVRPFAFELILEPAIETEVYMSFRSEAALWIPLSLQSPSVFWSSYLRKELWNMLFFGYMLALTIVAAFVAVAMRDRGYVYYTLTTLTFVGFLFCFMQYPVYFKIPGFLFWSTTGIMLLSGISGPAFLLYTRYFLELQKYSKRLDRFVVITAMAGLAVVLMTLPASYAVMAQLGVIQTQICLLVGLAVNIIFVCQGHRTAVLYLAAWSVFLLAMLLRILAVWGLLSSIWISDNMMQISSAIGYTLFLLALNDRIRKINRDKLAAQAQSLASQLAMTQELERKLKAETELYRQRETLLRDVHDGVGGITANLRMMSGLAQAAPDMESMRAIVSRMDALTAEGVTEVRSLMNALDVKAPDWLIVESEFRRYGRLCLEPHGIMLTVSADLAEELPGMSVSYFIGLYRVYKEALANVVKHSRAKSVTVKLNTEADSVLLTIADNGVGLSADTREGRGMRSMKARIMEMGGTMDVQNTASGLCLVFRLPLMPG